MLEIKFKTPHVNRMTKENLVGKPLYKEGILTGQVTDAVQVEIDGELYWEVTAVADIQLDADSPVKTKIVIPSPVRPAIKFQMTESEPGEAEQLIPSKVPAALCDQAVVKFLLLHRSKEFIEKLDYEKIKKRCEAGALHVLKSSSYIDPRNGSFDFTGVVGRVQSVERSGNGLVVCVRMNKDHQFINVDHRKARSTYSLESAADVRVRLAWAGHISSSETTPYSTGCFYLTPEALINPM